MEEQQTTYEPMGNADFEEVVSWFPKKEALKITTNRIEKLYCIKESGKLKPMVDLYGPFGNRTLGLRSNQWLYIAKKLSSKAEGIGKFLEIKCEKRNEKEFTSFIRFPGESDWQ